MTYLQRTLLKKENILFETRPHWMVFASAVLLFLLGCVIWSILAHFQLSRDPNGQLSIMMWIVWLCYAAAVIQWIRMWIFHHFSDYGITNKRAVMKAGWIARDTYETFLERVEGTRVDQSILGRLFGYGTLVVIGTGGTRDAFAYVPSVLSFRHKLQQAMEQRGSVIRTNNNGGT